MPLRNNEWINKITTFFLCVGLSYSQKLPLCFFFFFNIILIYILHIHILLYSYTLNQSCTFSLIHMATHVFYILISFMHAKQCTTQKNNGRAQLVWTGPLTNKVFIRVSAYARMSANSREEGSHPWQHLSLYLSPYHPFCRH